ncbi:Hypp8332 [Branchiostoma lanceolatum]|uniref:Hypp8332 protein n=1 Tax=Branchiostoma lanceolatum TaxID=7740 RepID=A0A8J9Z6F0_BRALA|nr:Hypp8332 [Branchiostoma lanceolatum]
MLEARNPLAAFHRAYQRQLKAVGQGTILPLHKLRVAWDCFSHLLAIDWDAVFKCAECGHQPEVIICEWTSVGFRKDLIRQNPTQDTSSGLRSSNVALFEKLRGDTPILVDFLHGVYKAESNRIPDDVSALVIDIMDMVSLPFRHEHDNSVYPLPEEEVTFGGQSFFPTMLPSKKSNKGTKETTGHQGCSANSRHWQASIGDETARGRYSVFEQDSTETGNVTKDDPLRKTRKSLMKRPGATLKGRLVRSTSISGYSGTESDSESDAKGQTRMSQEAMKKMLMEYIELMTAKLDRLLARSEREKKKSHSCWPGLVGGVQHLYRPTRAGQEPPLRETQEVLSSLLGVSAQGPPLLQEAEDLGERVRVIVPEIFSIQDLITNNTYWTNGYGQLNSNTLEAIYEHLAAMEDTTTSPGDRQFHRTVNTYINKKAKI